jgi:signal transduction histidine kinase/CheY-like chemotaxis protein
MLPSQAEKTILDLAFQLRAIVDNAPVAISEWDRDLSIVLWSPAAERLFGLYAADLVGRNLTTPKGRTASSNDKSAGPLPSVLAEVYLSDLVEVFGHGDLQRAETSVELAAGRRYFETTYVPLNDEAGRVRKVAAWTIDNTARRQAEEALREHSENLAAEVGRRTAELEALSNHLQGVAENEKALIARELHDELGGTLTGVKFSHSLLASTLKSNPEALAMVEQAQRLVDRALDATKNLIGHLRPPVLDNLGLLAALDWQSREFTATTSIPCQLSLPDSEPDLGEERIITVFRVFQEILTNVAKHARASRVEAALTMGCNAVTLTVSDDGIGVKKTPKSESGGIGGIGGFGIRGMIERARHLGGSVTFDSGPERGTLVVVKIPFARRTRQLRVLLADDHSIVRDGIRQLLETATDDMQVAGEATNGVEAVEQALSGQFDLVLLDISMPKMSGVEALGHIKSKAPDLPVLMVSTHPAEIYGERMLELGADGYVDKENASEQLIETIRQALKARAAA